MPRDARSTMCTEEEIARLLVRGLSNRQIARELFISEVTVKVHLRHIYDKIGVRKRTQAVILLGERADVLRAPNTMRSPAGEA